MDRYFINSEASSQHWSFFDCEDEVVLDLGCGRWGVNDLLENSPIYFKNKGAALVIGVDSNNDDIEFYRKNTTEEDGYIFINKTLLEENDLAQLIEEYKPTAIKSDIEGYEYHIFKDLVGSHLEKVNKLAVEFHSKELFPLFMTKFLEWGFKIEVFASFGSDEINCSKDNMGVLYGKK